MIAFYSGVITPTNHIELPLIAIRPERDLPARRQQLRPRFSRNVERHVRSFLSLSRAEKIVFSAEALSYLRHEDEVQRLRNLFRNYDVRVVVYIRDKAEFLSSYTDTLLRNNFTLSKDPTHFAYCEADTWLVDYDALIQAYRNVFGQ